MAFAYSNLYNILLEGDSDTNPIEFCDIMSKDFKKSNDELLKLFINVNEYSIDILNNLDNYEIKNID